MTDDKVLRKRVARTAEEIRSVLLEWDPIGVASEPEGGPEDEYDCLIYPLLKRIESGAPKGELVGFLERELVGHFGLSVWPPVAPVADRLLALVGNPRG